MMRMMMKWCRNVEEKQKGWNRNDRIEEVWYNEGESKKKEEEEERPPPQWWVVDLKKNQTVKKKLKMVENKTMNDHCWNCY